MWDEKTGIYRNFRVGSRQFLDVLSPCNFYALLSGTATNEQADRMINEHYFNPEEFYGEFVMPASARNARGFKDNNYWRGRIWAPLNFLVYLGMKDYRTPTVDKARADLVERSRNLLMKNWKENGGIYENYNSVTGAGGDAGASDAFYHWGALLTFIGILRGATDPLSAASSCVLPRGSVAPRRNIAETIDIHQTIAHFSQRFLRGFHYTCEYKMIQY